MINEKLGTKAKLIIIDQVLAFEFSHSLSGIEPIKVFVVATLDVAILATLIVLDPSAIT